MTWTFLITFFRKSANAVVELFSTSNSSGMISELHEIDSIKLDFELVLVNTALTTWVSMHSKSTSKSSSDRTSGQKILLRASASTLLCPHLYLMVKL